MVFAGMEVAELEGCPRMGPTFGARVRGPIPPPKSFLGWADDL